MTKHTDSGFTLIEIAIVLVIIGLLLGGVLKGQELINSAKVKNLATDFRNIPVFIYTYQDKFRALPGDDANATTHMSGATTATTPTGNIGNGVINGNWDSVTATDESILFWQHIRLAGLAAGETAVNTAAGNSYLPANVVGGRIGITSGNAGASPITGLKGTHIICSGGIAGKFAKQLDSTLDDGNTAASSMMVMAEPATHPATVPAAPVATADIDDAASYTVCMGV
ncbi:MAG TPA: prepilin-type N-terminal cleavage/methylation domain-containing protein [Gallionella sp.]|nr:prepilin-type N-terminal cleavage/methylation domain-containing protein [Gallionella sp.]